nr:uncharacterized protein LOC117860786 [Setaria viridis]
MFPHIYMHTYRGPSLQRHSLQFPPVFRFNSCLFPASIVSCSSTAAGYSVSSLASMDAVTPMSTRGSSRAMYTGLIILLLAVGAGINFGDCDGLSGPLLSFLGVVAGANMIAAVVRTADDPAAPIGAAPAAFAGARAFMRRNLAVVGLVMVSSASTAAAGETGPAFSFMMFVLLVFGVSLINIGVHSA